LDDLDRDLGDIKMKFLSFQGKNNLEAWLEWGQNGVDFLLSPLLWGKESKTYCY
jgi:hypothetical protein